MARQSPSSASAYDEEFDPRKAWRLGIWASVAMAAVISALVAGFINSGTRRARPAEPGRPAASAPPVPGSPGFDAEMESRRLAEAVRLLAADRDRLMARINTLERSLGDVTGSISAGAASRSNPSAAGIPPMLAPAPAATASPAPGHPAVAAANPPAVAGTAALRSAQSQGAPSTAGAGHAAEPATVADRLADLVPIVDSGPSGSVATKTDFGVDLGSAGNVEALRALWHSVRGANEALFDGLRPVVAVREGSKPGIVELRLVAGPLTNAGAAARVCATLAAAASTCQPTVFDGQRLALK